MAYQIYIRREHRKAISLTEWHDAIQQIEHVRLAHGDNQFINPQSQEVITIFNSGGDAEVFFPQLSKWIRVFSWHDGEVSFKSVGIFDKSGDPVRRAATTLAGILNARIIGEEGEGYE